MSAATRRVRPFEYAVDRYKKGDQGVLGIIEKYLFDANPYIDSRSLIKNLRQDVANRFKPKVNGIQTNRNSSVHNANQTPGMIQTAGELLKYKVLDYLL